MVGRDVQDRTEVRALIVDSLIWASFGALVLAILGGLLMRRAVLARVETINRTASAIVQAAASQSGATYCWRETTAPVGLAGGAAGCFVADNGQGAEPIVVSDAGEFVGVAVEYVGVPGNRTIRADYKVIIADDRRIEIYI